MARDLSFLYLLAWFFLLPGCAQVRSLPGGSKDSSPPQVLEMMPPNLSSNFNSKNITITFDEYVQVANLQEQLIISPPMEQLPSVRVKQRSLFIEFKEELKNDVTYTLNFGDAISDLNEGNKISNLLYVFSTGPEIDSLTIEGTISRFWEGDAAKNHKVLLFENDSAIFNRKISPRYFARTEDNGNFLLPYLHEGDYFLYAIDDLNANFHWDEGESYAALPNSLSLRAGDSLHYSLNASVPKTEFPEIGEYAVDSCGSLKFALSPGYSVAVKSLNNLNSHQLVLQDTLYYWLDGTPTDRKEEIEISGIGQFNDTLEIPFFRSAFEKSFKLQTLFDQKIRDTDSLFIFSPIYLYPQDSDKIKIKKDSLDERITIMPCRDNLYRIVARMQKGKSYELIIEPGAFANAAGIPNDSLQFNFSTLKTEDLGSIELSLKKSESLSKPLLLVFNKDEKLVYQKENAVGELEIQGLVPGEYILRLVDDKNENLRFDPALPADRLQPEDVFVYPSKVNVRANWNVRLDW